MIDIRCHFCGALVGTGEFSREELAQAFEASTRRGRFPSEEDYASSRAIVQEQNRLRDLILDHMQATHPEVYWHTFPVVLPAQQEGHR